MSSERDSAGEVHNLIVGTGPGNVVQAGHVDALHLVPAVAVALAGLPAEDGFTGRLADLAALAALLDPAIGDSAPPVTAITGMGGIGKSALAVRAAYQAVAAGWFPGGVLFVNLHGYDPDGSVSAHAALGALLGALGITGERIPSTQDEREVRYRSELTALAANGKRVLILVDNASDTVQVRALRPPGPIHRMLITSRDNLPLLGARRVEVGALPDAEAIDVLATALHAARPEDTRITDQSHDALSLVRLCGCLPLALRIIAEILADRPGQPIGRLVRTLTATNRLVEFSYGAAAVQVAFETSYQRLPAAVARLFRLLSLHPGPCVGVGAVAALAGVGEDAAFRLAETLRRTHLLQSATTGAGYQFHDLVRLYARQQAEDDETAVDRNDAIGRLVAYYWKATQAANTHLEARTSAADRSGLFAGRRAAVTWLESERPNLIPVINLAVRKGFDEHTRSIVVALGQFFFLRKHVDEWITVSKFGLGAAQRLGDVDGQGRTLNYLGLAHQDLRWYVEASRYYERALAVYQQAGNRRGQSNVWSNLGGVSYETGQSDQAVARSQQALSLAQEIGDRFLQGTILNNLGFFCVGTEQYNKAEGYYQQALDCAREVRDRQREGTSLTNLGVVYQRTGRFDEAIECHQQALEALRESGDRLREGRALHNLALVYEDLDSWADALECHQQALPIRQEVGDRYGEGETLTHLGLAYSNLDRLDDARACQERALAAFIQSGADDDAELARRRIDELTGR